jgi:hypothetical protein
VISDEGDALQMYRIAMNVSVLNKQSRTTENGRSSYLGVGQRAKNFSPYKIV